MQNTIHSLFQLWQQMYEHWFHRCYPLSVFSREFQWVWSLCWLPSLSHCCSLVVETGVLGTWLGVNTAGGRKWKAAEAGWREKSVCKREFKPAAGRKSKGREISWMRQSCGTEGKERLQWLQILPQKLPFARECFAVSLPILTFSWVFNCPIKT